MILDMVKNGSVYFPAGSALSAGLEFLMKTQAEDIREGRHEIDGERIFALVQSYTTSPPAGKPPESHRLYVDIQAVLSGEELVEWAPVSGLRVETPYSPEKDVTFYAQAERAAAVILRPGLFAVFFPEDAHKPACSTGRPAAVRKIVVKVRV